MAPLRLRRIGPAAVLLLVLLPASPAQSGPEPNPERGPRMERLIDRCAADEAALRSFYSQRLSALRAERLDQFAQKWLERLGRVAFDALDVDGRADYVLLRDHLEHRLHQSRIQREHNEEMLALLPFAPDLMALEEARRRLETVDPRLAAGQLTAHLTALKAVRKRVERGLGKDGGANSLKPTRVAAQRASQGVEALTRVLKNWFEYRDGFEPAFGWWVRAPYASLLGALKDYARFLRERVAKVKKRPKDAASLLGDPIGRDALLAALAHEFICYTPEQLIAIAEREFAWCEKQGLEAARTLGVEGGWDAAVEHVKSLHAPPGAQDDLVARQARAAITFLDEHDLVTVPALCRETWRLEMISKRGQETLPFAVYGGQQMKVAYATEDMEHEAKLMSMRGNNEHFTRIVTPHELIPGHHLQQFMARRQRAYRGLFRSPFFVEGWALHWEMLLWDKGYARDARDRVGMLFWRMHRCARIIVSLRFHLGQMEPSAMVDFLVDRVGLERDGALGEVRRYVGSQYGPLYQCAYMVGGLQLRALHRELVGAGKMGERAFHDAVLQQGSIPIEILRVALTRGKLTRDHRAGWEFCGAVEVAPKSK